MKRKLVVLARIQVTTEGDTFTWPSVSQALRRLADQNDEARGPMGIVDEFDKEWTSTGWEITPAQKRTYTNRTSVTSETLCANYWSGMRCEWWRHLKDAVSLARFALKGWLPR